MQTFNEQDKKLTSPRTTSLSKCLPVLLAVGAFGLSVPAFAVSSCGGKPCVSAMSVVSAAGDDLRAALAKVEFDGDALAPQSKDAIADVAKAWTAMKSKKPLGLRVLADSSLKGPAVRKQAVARGQALTQALVNAGVPEKQIKITH